MFVLVRLMVLLASSTFVTSTCLLLVIYTYTQRIHPY